VFVKFVHYLPSVAIEIPIEPNKVDVGFKSWQSPFFDIVQRRLGNAASAR
jgi:hypothetical protein